MIEEVGVPASMAGLGEEPSTGMVIAANLLAGALKKVEFRSAISPPVIYGSDDIRKMILEPPKPRPPGEKSPMERVKPTLVLDFTAGARKTIAPFGVADDTEWKTNTTKVVLAVVGLWAGLIGAGYYLGYRAGKRAR
jgi:hypothetical protein